MAAKHLCLFIMIPGSQAGLLFFFCQLAPPASYEIISSDLSLSCICTLHQQIFQISMQPKSHWNKWQARQNTHFPNEVGEIIQLCQGSFCERFGNQCLVFRRTEVRSGCLRQ